MRPQLLSLLILMLLVACNQIKPSASENVGKETENLVKAAIPNKSGDTLFIEYHNAKSEGVFNLNGNRVTLQQDTTASGVQYSNKDFKYTEWHGQSHYYQNGKLIFSNE